MRGDGADLMAGGTGAEVSVTPGRCAGNVRTACPVKAHFLPATRSVSTLVICTFKDNTRRLRGCDLSPLRDGSHAPPGPHASLLFSS